MKLGIIYFSSIESGSGGDRYRSIFETARFADQNEFSTVWAPERHFTKDGWLHPNPSVLMAALARETSRIRLHGGSVVLPLHDPLRVAEEWAVVDNLSRGRVGIAFASGWHPGDFALAPQRYESRREHLYEGVRTVQRLWRGETIRVEDGEHRAINVRTYPPPVQPELPLWITSAGDVATFRAAGELGANVLTHLFNQDVEELERKIAVYRSARVSSGHDAGQVCVMLHTFVSQRADVVRKEAHGAFRRYLGNAAYLIDAISKSRGGAVRLQDFGRRELDEYAAFVFDRLLRSGRLLFGTPAELHRVVERLEAAGATEIACQFDFGVADELVSEMLPALDDLRRRCDGRASVTAAVGAGATSDVRSAWTRLRASFRHEVDPRSLPRITEASEDVKCIRRVWRRAEQVLAELDVDPAPDRALDAVLLDVCYRLLGRADAREGGARLRPLGIAQLIVHRAPPSSVWCHACLHDTQPVDELVGNVDVYDEHGDPVWQLVGVRLHRSVEARRDEDLLYEETWEHVPRPPEETRVRSSDPSRWLIFADAGGVAESLRQHITERGDECTLWTSSEFGVRARDDARPTFDSLLDALRDALRQRFDTLVFLWGLDVHEHGRTESASFRAADRRGVLPLVAIVRALCDVATQSSPRIWIATRGAQGARATFELSGLLQTPIWGFARVAAHEHPELWGGIVDLDPTAAPAAAAACLWSEILACDGEDEIAYSDGRRLVARLQPARVGDARRTPVRADGSYLVSGGLGDLGLRCAQWLAERGARHIVLISRTDRPPGSNLAVEIVSDLERAGVHVHKIAADVSDPAGIQQCRSQLESRGVPRIRGILHLAGVARGAVVSDMTPDLMEEVSAPKALGAYNLHGLFADEPLDFFVLFSSPAATLGFHGQGAANYAAASAFLDGLARFRRAHSLPAVSLAWGPWSEIGLAARSKHAPRAAALGVGTISPDEALRVLDHFAAGPNPHVLATRLDWQRLASRLSAAQVRRKLAAWLPKPDAVTPPILRERLLGVANGDRAPLLFAYLSEHCARVLGCTSDSFDATTSLTSLGFDSLMAIELRHKIEADLGIRASFADLLQDSDLQRLTATLLAALDGAPRRAPAVSALGDEST